VGGAAGGAAGRFTWLANLGMQFAFARSDGRIPDFHPYALAGGTFDIARWLRAYALVDLHVLAALGDHPTIVPYGATLGFEAGTFVFVSVSSWAGRSETAPAQISCTGNLSLGFRLDGASP